MRVLVTGSEGRIGRWQVKLLREAGYTVRTFDVTEQKEPGGDHLHGDLRDLPTVRQAVAGMDAVINLGAIPTDWPGHEEQVIAVNVQGTWNILHACQEAGIRRAVCFSSVQALGLCGGVYRPTYFPIDDVHPHHPRTPYQLSKHLTEETCRMFSETYGMTIFCLRPVYVAYSEEYAGWSGQLEDPRQHWAVHDFGAYVDVRDVCQAAALCLTTPHTGYDAFLLTADDICMEIPTTELTGAHFSDIPWKQEQGHYLKEKTHRALFDCSHAKNRLGWQPEYPWR